MKRIDDADLISSADKQLLAEVKRAIIGMLPDATVLLYGSAARGQRQPDSDYDVLVLTGTELSTLEEDRVRSAVYELELKRDAVLSVSLWAVARWNMPIMSASPYRRNVEKEGVLL